MREHLRTGIIGEEMAARFLEEKGLRILEKRVRLGHLEIDLVARQGKEWIFVEVKTRRSRRQGSATEAMTFGKNNRFRRAVAQYLQLHHLEREPIRCDFLAIDFDAADNVIITHYPGEA